jgi:hypothetical protein
VSDADDNEVSRVLATIADPAGNPVGLAGHRLPSDPGPV